MSRKLNERELLVLTCVAQGKGKYEDLAAAILQSIGSAQKIVARLKEWGYLTQVDGPSKKKSLGNGLRLTDAGRKAINV